MAVGQLSRAASRLLGKAGAKRLEGVAPELEDYLFGLASRSHSRRGFMSPSAVPKAERKGQILNRPDLEPDILQRTPSEVGRPRRFNRGSVGERFEKGVYDAERNLERLEDLGPEVFGVREIPTYRLGQVAARLTEGPLILRPGQTAASSINPHGVSFSDRVVAGEVFPLFHPAGRLSDELGPYRSRELLKLFVSENLNPEQMRRTITHELGHAMIGIRDPHASAEVLKAVIGTKRWEALRPSLVEASKRARPESWVFAEIEKASGRGDLLRYLNSDSELLADAISRLIDDPRAEREALKQFLKSIQALLNEDPLSKGTIRFEAVFPFVAAAGAAGALVGSQTDRI